MPPRYGTSTELHLRVAAEPREAKPLLSCWRWDRCQFNGELVNPLRELIVEVRSVCVLQHLALHALSTDPDFVAKVRDVVGLYIAHPNMPRCKAGDAKTPRREPWGFWSDLTTPQGDRWDAGPVSAGAAVAVSPDVCTSACPAAASRQACRLSPI